MKSLKICNSPNTVSVIKLIMLALCSNPQPEGSGLHIYIPWRLGGLVIPPGTEYPF
jgi:hypothetical protein